MKSCPNCRCEYCGDDFALETGHPHFVKESSGKRTYFCSEFCQTSYEAGQCLMDLQIHEVNAVAQ